MAKTIRHIEFIFRLQYDWDYPTLPTREELEEVQERLTDILNEFYDDLIPHRKLSIVPKTPAH